MQESGTMVKEISAVCLPAYLVDETRKDLMVFDIELVMVAADNAYIITGRQITN